MLLDIVNKNVYEEISISESKLQELLIENFSSFFPSYVLIENEYVIRGDVRQFGMSGRIDILAYSPKEKKLVIFELKKVNSKNILIQSLDYFDFIQENIKGIVPKLSNISETEKNEILKSHNPPKIILIARSFLHPTIRRSQNFTNNVELYTYSFFTNNLFQLSKVYQKRKYLDSEIKESSEIDIISVVKDIIQNDLIDEKLYLIENSVLTINSTVLYEGYQEYLKNSKVRALSFRLFFKEVKAKDEYIQNLSTKRFKKNNTSVIELKF